MREKVLENLDIEKLKSGFEKPTEKEVMSFSSKYLYLDNVLKIGGLDFTYEDYQKIEEGKLSNVYQNWLTYYRSCCFKCN